MLQVPTPLSMQTFLTIHRHKSILNLLGTMVSCRQCGWLPKTCGGYHPDINQYRSSWSCKASSRCSSSYWGWQWVAGRCIKVDFGIVSLVTIIAIYFMLWTYCFIILSVLSSYVEKGRDFWKEISFMLVGYCYFQLLLVNKFSTLQVIACIQWLVDKCIAF